MSDLAQSDIFFFVTTVVIVAMGVLLVAILLYVLSIIRDVKHISKIARAQSGTLFETVRVLVVGFAKTLLRTTVLTNIVRGFINKKGAKETKSRRATRTQK